LKNGDDRSEKLRLFIDNLYEILIEKPQKSKPSEKVINSSPFLGESSQAQQNECIHRVTGETEEGKIVCSRFFLKKAKIVEVDPDFCNHCWELQNRLKTSGIPTASSIPSMYKKPEKIYCIDDTLYIDPLKHQAKCHNCKTKNFRMWAECQRHQAKRANQ